MGVLIFSWICIGLLALILIIAFIAFLNSGCEDPTSGGTSGVAFVLLGVFLPFLISFTVNFNKEYTKHVCDIISIRRESETSGMFFLGSGYVEETQYYFYYYKTAKGYKLDKQKVKNTYIIEDNSVTPCVYEIKEKDAFDSYYTIYVPEGTIVTTFTL